MQFSTFQTMHCWHLKVMTHIQLIHAGCKTELFGCESSPMLLSMSYYTLLNFKKAEVSLV